MLTLQVSLLTIFPFSESVPVRRAPAGTLQHRRSVAIGFCRLCRGGRSRYEQIKRTNKKDKPIVLKPAVIHANIPRPTFLMSWTCTICNRKMSHHLMWSHLAAFHMRNPSVAPTKPWTCAVCKKTMHENQKAPHEAGKAHALKAGVNNDRSQTTTR